MAIAKIHTEKVIIRGKQFIKIKHLEGVLTNEQLPEEYTDGTLCFFACANHAHGDAPSQVPFSDLNLLIPGSEDPFPRLTGSEHVRNGASYHQVKYDIHKLTEAEFKWLLCWLRRAGARPTKINRRLAEENKDWHGEEVHEI